MPIDASIPLRAGQPVFNLAESMMNAERMKSMRAQRERAQWEWEQAKAQAERDAKARGSLADLILAQNPTLPGLPDSGTMGMPTDPNPGARGIPGAQAERMASPAVASRDVPGAPMEQGRMPLDPASVIPAGPPRPNPWADYVHADPNAAVDYRAASLKWQKQQFDHAQELNDAGLQILGSVYDQRSWQRAKNVARALYAKFGMNLDEMQLPDEYSPELVRSLQMQAMDTKDQLATIRAERKQEWDMADDQLDNERADRNTDSLIDNRDGRLSEYRRHNRTSEGNTRRGQDMTDSRIRSGAGRAKSSDYAKPTATDAKGNKVEWNGKAWVPVK